MPKSLLTRLKQLPKLEIMDLQPLPALKLDAQKIHKKLKLAGELFEFALKIETAKILRKSPELSEEEAQRRAYQKMCRTNAS